MLAHLPHGRDRIAAASRTRGARALRALSAQRLGGRWAPRLARLLAALVLFLVTPGAVEVGEELVSAGTGAAVSADGCDDGCDDGAEDCCPRTCAHCTRCAHASALPSTSPMLPGRRLPSGSTFAWAYDGGGAPGYRAPPFRPPTA